MSYSNLEKKRLFLDVSFTNIHTLVTSLYQCVEIRSVEVLLTAASANSAHRFNVFLISEMFATQL
jgi:hypothetical protein